MKKNVSEEKLDRLFFALSDKTRRNMLAQLATGEVTVSSLAEPYEMSLPAVLKHLAILRGAGLISEEKEGRIRRCKLDPKELKRVSDWVSYYQKFWESQFDKLEEYLEKIESYETKRTKK